MRHAAVAALALALAAAPLAASAHDWGWGGTAGDGKKVTQQRTVGEFKAVRLEGSLDVKVKVGAPVAVSVTIDENLQPLVRTRLDGDTLVIASEGMSYRGTGQVELSTPTLGAFAIEGSGDAVIDGAKGDQALAVSGSGDLTWRGAAVRLKVSIQGSGDVRLAGSADQADLGIDGSGDIHARDLTARSAKVAVAGSGDVEVNGTAQVERAAVAGSGEISHR